ncbi:MAG: tRNA pseudouridine(38-40) synthase TruA [Phycisphaerales bacterium]|nr:tRNA pseudouridine(38-40) synthase TruA [Phycisphaerales bacterium]
MVERNVRLLLAYDGTDFHGWQRQPNLRTVQGVVEDALQRLIGHPLELVGSGRTDAGVHAVGQCANVRIRSRVPTERLAHALNGRLPGDVAVVSAEQVSDEFHATQGAVRKRYRYTIYAMSCPPVASLQHRYAYHYWEPLDIARMRRAASYFVGTMDYSAMASSGCVRRTMVRTVFRCDVRREYQCVYVEVDGSGFLYNQVRNMVGTLLEVGRGRWEPDCVAGILASRNRVNAGPTAPAHGLCLQWVEYPEHLLKPPETTADIPA